MQFTYPPFAAVIFAVASVLSWTAMRWAMTLAGLACLAALAVAAVLCLARGRPRELGP